MSIDAMGLVKLLRTHEVDIPGVACANWHRGARLGIRSEVDTQNCCHPIHIVSAQSFLYQKGPATYSKHLPLSHVVAEESIVDHQNRWNCSKLGGARIVPHRAIIF